MTDQQKKELGNFELRTRFQMPRGGKMSLAFILEAELKAQGSLTELALPEYKTDIHPCLYYLFLIDWKQVTNKRVPTKFGGDGLKFGRAVIDEWLDICNNNRYFREGMLDNYDNISQVREVMFKMINNNLQYIGPDLKPSLDFYQMEERLFSIRQQFLDAQRAIDQKAEQERKLAEAAERKQREAERKASQKDGGDTSHSPSAPVPAASIAGSSASVAVGSAAASIETMILETQRLLSQVPNLTPTVTLAVFPERETLPYASILQWDADSRYSFYGNSFAETITHAKEKASQLIDHEIHRQRLERQRAVIQQQIDAQNASFESKMAENRKMIEQLQKQMADQQALHQKNISQLQKQIASL